MKVRWVFHGGDEIYILFPTLNVTVNCLDLTYIRNSQVDFHPQFTSRKFTWRRHNFTLPWAQKRITFWLYFKWFNNPTLTITWCRHDTFRRIKRTFENRKKTVKKNSPIIIAAMILIWLMQANEWVASNRILMFSQRFLGSPWGKHSNSLERNEWRKAVSRSKKTIMERDHSYRHPEARYLIPFCLKTLEIHLSYLQSSERIIEQ